MNPTDHSLYNIHRGPAGFTIGKFDSSLNLLAAYDVDPKHCTCPAGPRPSCRHRKMLPRMLAKVNTPEFYCYETNTWHRPLQATEMQVYGEGSAEPVDVVIGEAVSCPKPAAEPSPAPPSTIRRR